ncbi:hypothetical protein C8Q77DRAFT_253431 [Trametes polyzona]|nr:hypothetical protein C8Q77DRAFT_253431 [Trametes polyzona]
MLCLCPTCRSPTRSPMLCCSRVMLALHLSLTSHAVHAFEGFTGRIVGALASSLFPLCRDALRPRARGLGCGRRSFSFAESFFNYSYACRRSCSLSLGIVWML